MLYLTRKEHFNAAHKLYNHNWSEEKNETVFGKCANANWHGHNYDLYVTVKGEPSHDTGFIMNAKELGDIIKREVLNRFDHKNLNEDVSYFKEMQPSTENFAKIIWQIIEPHIIDCRLHCVRLHETETIYAEYYGEN